MGTYSSPGFGGSRWACRVAGDDENARNGTDLDCRVAIVDRCGAKDCEMLEVRDGVALTAHSSDRRAANVNADIVADCGVYVEAGDVVGCCTRGCR